MPTSKPRIQVALSPQVHETITRMARLQNRSRSSVIAEIIETVHPPLMRTVALLEAAAEAPKQVKEGLLKTIEEMERQMVGSAGSGMAQLDWLLGKMNDDSKKAGSGAATSNQRSAAGGSTTWSGEKINPHIVTRGSGFKGSKKNKNLESTTRGAKKGGKKGVKRG